MQLLVMIMVGFVTQFINGTAGMGFGVFSSSVLIGLGFYPSIVSATAHTAKIFVSFFSGGAHLYFNNVKKSWLLPLVIPGVLGGILGAYLLTFISEDGIGAMKPLIAGILLSMGIITLWRFLKGKAKVLSYPPGSTIEPASVSTLTDCPKNEKSESKFSLSKISLLGFLAAFIDALGGGGWGPITTPGLILSENTEPRKVIGTVNIAEFFVTIAISLTFILVLGLKSFDWIIILAIIIGGVIAAPVSAYLCKRLPVRILGILVGVVLIGINLRTIIETI